MIYACDVVESEFIRAEVMPSKKVHVRELKKFATQVVASLSAWPVNLDSVLQEMDDYAASVESKDEDLKTSQCIGRCIFWMYQTVVNDIMRNEADEADRKGPSKALAQMIMVHLNEQFPQGSDEEEDDDEEEEEEDDENVDEEEEEDDVDDEEDEKVVEETQAMEEIKMEQDSKEEKKDDGASDDCMMVRQKTMIGDIRKRGRSF